MRRGIVRKQPTRNENEIEDDVTDFGMTTEQLLNIDLREAGKNL